MMNPSRLIRSLIVATLLMLAIFAPARSQTPAPLDRDLRVFLDCTDFRCDDDFFIEEIPWVDFVRDRQDADVHVQGTRQSTGAGGSEYTLAFIGRGRFTDRESTLTLVDPPDATDDSRRRSLLRVIRLGLAPYAAQTGRGPALDIVYTEPEAGAADGGPVRDPWNHWVFRTRLSSYVNGESQQNFTNVNYSLSASRVTEAWKHSLSMNGSYDRDYFEYEELDSLGALVSSDTIVSQQRSYGVHMLHVKSISAHWSVGGRASWRMSDYGNQDANLRLMPAVEFSVYPYSESTRRQFTVLYSIGPSYYDYQEVTLFDRSHEALIQQQLVGSYDVTQPWGSVELSVGASHFVAHLGDGPGWPDAQYSVSSFAEFDVRLFKGLSLNAWGGIDWVRDQIHLPAGGSTEREILLRQRELATSYRYFGQVGLSYTFGSIYSPIVNPRLDAL